MGYSENNYPKKDLYQDITDQFIAEIEKGTLPWQKGWDSKAGVMLLKIPQNAVTGEPYHKVNAITLHIAAQQFDNGNDPRFCSFNAAKANGWYVKKGSHGFPVLHGFWADKDNKGQPLPEEQQHWQRRFSTVFHASQLEMFDENGNRVPIPSYEAKAYTHQETMDLAENLLRESGAVILHDQADQAFYRPSTDDIHLPAKEAFPQLENYYATALHELGHWTGHKSRLNRDTGQSFGTEGYAKEELRAEMASVYLAMKAGLPCKISNHAAYMNSWLNVLKKDKTELFKATADAEKIAEYVIGLVKSKEKSIQSVQTAQEQLEPIASQEIPRTDPLVAKIQDVAVMNPLFELEDVKNAKSIFELHADEKEIYFAYLKHVLTNEPELVHKEADIKVIALLGKVHMDYETIKNVISYSPEIQKLDKNEREIAVKCQVFDIVNPVLTQIESVKNAKEIVDLRSWSNPDEIYFSYLKKVLYENPLLKAEEANQEVASKLLQTKMKPCKVKECLMYSLHINDKNMFEKQQYAKDLVDNQKERPRALAR